MTERNKLIADKWHSLTEEDKLPFKLEADEDKKRYQLEIAQETAANGGIKLPRYNSSMKKNHGITKTSGAVSLNSTIAFGDKPKQNLPPQAWNIFKSEKWKQMTDIKTSGVEKLKMISKMWSELSPEEKKKYEKVEQITPPENPEDTTQSHSPTQTNLYQLRESQECSNELNVTNTLTESQEYSKELNITNTE